MEVIALIVSGLALLAAGVCLYLLMQEKKRSLKQKTAFFAYVDKTADSIKRDIRAEDDQSWLQVGLETDDKIAKALIPLADRIEKLENGLVPDYQAAMRAAEAVNDFNQGISNILGFDPMETIVRGRESTKAVDE